MIRKKIYTGIYLILATVAVYLAVGLCYTVLISILDGFTPVLSLPQARSASLETPEKRPMSYYAAISRRNIFDAVQKTGQAPEPEVNLDHLKKTDLALILLGTISGMGNDSYAVIEDTKNRIQDLYQIGDSVSGATIKLILRKKVVLSLNGQDEVLEMNEEEDSNAAMRRIASRAPARGRYANRQRDGSRMHHILLNRGEVDTAFNNVNDLMKDVRIRPHFSQGKPDGLLLSDVSPNSIFGEMGLRSSDVIVGVNGKAIRTVDDCMNVYRNLKSSEEVTLEIKRGGQKEFIKYNIK